MQKRVIWTKQHKDIVDILMKQRRYIALKDYILQGKDDISKFYFEAYNWYTKNAADIVKKPDDVKYPIWISLNKESVLALDVDTVLLEVEIDGQLIVEMDYAKWGYVVNYYYIPKDKDDEKRHSGLLESYGIDDQAAYMSGFYPHIKKEIIKSWDAVFDKSRFNSVEKVGTIWEIKQEWVKNITYFND